MIVRGCSMPCAAVLVLLTVACGGNSDGGAGSMREQGCRSATAAAARIGSADVLGDAPPVLRQAIAVEQALLLALGGEGARGPTADRLRTVIATAGRALDAVERTDPLRSGTMSPLGTSVPSARRAATEARRLLREVCSSVDG